MDELQALRSREEVLDALELAAENRTRIMAAIAAAEDEPREVLVERFGLSGVGAEVILDMQLRRFAPAQVDRLRQERDEVTARIRALESEREQP